MKILGCILFILISSLGVITAEEKDVPDFENAGKEIFNQEIPQWIKYEYPYYLSGYDEDGVPIWVADLGKWRTKKIAEGTPEMLRDYKIHVLQMLKRWKEGTVGSPCNEFLGLFDMENYSIAKSLNEIQIKIWVARQAQQALKNVKGVYFLNVNFIFQNFFEVLKPFVGPLAYKIQMFGTNKDIWIPKLLRFIPNDQISPKYGGSTNHKSIEYFG